MAGEAITVDIDTPTGDLDSMRRRCSTATGNLVAFNDDSPTALDSRADLPAFPRTVATTCWSPASTRSCRRPVRLRQRLRRRQRRAVRRRRSPTARPTSTSTRSGCARATCSGRRSRAAAGSGDLRPGRRRSCTAPPRTPRSSTRWHSPLPGGGNAVTEHVADETGWHYVGGRAAATATTTSPSRPTGRRLERATPVQTLFLDFDGARVNTGIFGGPGVRDAEPAAGVPRPLGSAQRRLQPAHRRGSSRRSRENLLRTWWPAGSTPTSGSGSATAATTRDPFGQPNVSRVIVGGHDRGVRDPDHRRSRSRSTRATSRPRRPRWCCSTS